MADPQPVTYQILCLVFGELDPFPIDIASTKIVGDLKKVINAEKELVASKDAHKLTLFQVDLHDDDNLGENVNKKMNAQSALVALRATRKLNKIYDATPPEDTIHIVIQVPESEMTPAAARGTKRKRDDDQFVPRRPRRSDPTADITFITARRDSTVEALYKRLDSYHLVLVRGTPGSGKSTLAMLLANHLRTVHEVNPILINRWPQDNAPWSERLTEAYNPEGPNTIIIDEGQLTYWDDSFWNGFLKQIGPSSRDRVILFASYGSPKGRVSVEGTSMVIPDPWRVGLQPVDHKDNITQIGLLLTRDEFDDMVRRAFSNELFEKDFLDFVFHVTAGHAGAVSDILRLVIVHDSYRELKYMGGTYSLEVFKRKYPIAHLFSALENTSAFRRGLPSLNEMQVPKTAQVLREVLSNQFVNTGMLNAEDTGALERCFKMGWLHATVGRSEPQYIFTTPLHQWFVDYYLGTNSTHFTPLADQDPLSLAINVVTLFSRQHLSSPRQIGASEKQRPPEAQFQDEFYRCSHKYSNGSLTSFPEFGDANGKVDFYIPCKKWGVELLRDGHRLEGHSSRFTGEGAYAKMEFSDYIILDFRTKPPRKAHPEIPKLYHVVFTDDYKQASILDGSSLVKIREFTLLN